MEDPLEYIVGYLDHAARVLDKLDPQRIAEMLALLCRVRDSNGRLFVIGNGGSAANASHAVNDFRKISGIEAYSPLDNVAELTARVNDDGWRTALSSWLRTSRLGERDALLVLSVSGGLDDFAVSGNLVEAVRYAKECNAAVIGIVGSDGGFTARAADVCIKVPVPDGASLTAHTESFQSLLCHLLVSHPALRAAPMKWESLAGSATCRGAP